MPDKTKDVFVSHIHEDDEALQHLKDLAAKSSLNLRDSSINSTKPNEAKSPEYIKSSVLAPAIQWAGTLVVLVSPETHKSKWVEWEIDYAQKQGKRIVGVWAHGAKEADLPKNLDRYASALVGWNSDSVAGAITGSLNNWCRPDGTDFPARGIPRIKCQ